MEKQNNLPFWYQHVPKLTFPFFYGPVTEKRILEKYGKKEEKEEKKDN